MLERLLVENFQCHKRTEIIFSPEVTSITGDTDSGKSSLIRALIWIMTNSPRGNSFIKSRCNSTRVSLWVDSYKIVREKGNGINTYQLDDNPPYEAFGSEVPQAIEDILKTDSISFQRQLNPHFLFSSTPGEVAKELNSIVNLDLIDSVLSFLTTEQRKIKTLIQVSEDRLDKAKEKRDILEWTQIADRDLQDIENMQKTIEEKKTVICSLEKILDDLNTIDNKQQNSDELIMDMQELIQLGNEIHIRKRRMVMWKDVINQAEKIASSLEAAETRIEELQKELESNTNGLCPICGSVMDVTASTEA